ncbi:MAG: hypothetical protein AAGF31_03335 [Planctomycetota bacterium]
MSKKQEIIDALKPGLLNTNSRFMQIKREDLAVLCDVDLKAVAPPEAVDEELASLRAQKAELEKQQLQREIEALQAASMEEPALPEETNGDDTEQPTDD